MMIAPTCLLFTLGSLPSIHRVKIINNTAAIKNRKNAAEPAPTSLANTLPAINVPPPEQRRQYQLYIYPHTKIASKNYSLSLCASAPSLFIICSFVIDSSFVTFIVGWGSTPRVFLSPVLCLCPFVPSLFIILVSSFVIQILRLRPDSSGLSCLKLFSSSRLALLRETNIRDHS